MLKAEQATGGTVFLPLLVGALADDFGAEHGHDLDKVLAELLGDHGIFIEDGDLDLKRLAREEDDLGSKAQKPVFMDEDNLVNPPREDQGEQLLEARFGVIHR